MLDAVRRSNHVVLRGWLLERRGALVMGLLGLIAFCLTVYVCAPGYMARDSGMQLEQARRFEFWDDHPIVMSLIWHYTDRIVPGPLGMLALSSGLCWAGMSVLFWALPGPLLLRAVGLTLLGFFPPVFSVLPIILKDTLMQGALLLGLACLVVPSRRAYRTRLALGLALFLIAIGVRHNAAAAVWPFLALPLLALPVLEQRARALRLLIACVASLALTFGMARGLDKALSPITHKTEFWQTTATFDLAAMSLRTGEVLVDPESEVFGNGMGLNEIRKKFSVDYGPTLYYCLPFGGQRCAPVFRLTVDPEQLHLLSKNWLRAILQHPVAYLRHRIQFARHLLNVSASSKELYYLEGAPHHRLAKAYPLTQRATFVLAWIEGRFHAFWFLPVIYAALGCILVPVALVRHLRGSSALPLAYALSGLAYLLSVIVGASSTTYRYSTWTILCSLLGLITLFAFWATESFTTRAAAAPRGAERARTSD